MELCYNWAQILDNLLCSKARDLQYEGNIPHLKYFLDMTPKAEYIKEKI